MFKLPAAIALAISLSAMPAFAAMTEEIVDFQVDGQKVVGTLAMPDGGPAPVVILFHGFGGSRNELEIPEVKEGIYTRAARLLADRGFASLRIDFRGSGDSDGEFVDTTFSKQIADGLAAVDFVRSDARVDGKKIAIIGWSQGGLVASAVAGHTPTLKAVALWAAVGEPEVTFSKLLGADKIAAGLKTGDTPLELPMPWGFSLFMKQPYFEQIATTHPLEDIAAYKGPLFVSEGLKDEVIATGTGQKFIAAHDGEEQLFIRSMDHGFNSSEGVAQVDELVGETIKFFTPYLK